MVAELQMENGSWIAFMCGRPPCKILDAIFQNRSKFYEAAGRVQPEEIMKETPITFPVINVLEPGVGHFDVERVMGERMPHFTQSVGLCYAAKLRHKI